MRKSLHLLVFVLALALAYASAQSSGSSPSSSNQSTTSQPSQDQNQKPDTQPSQSGSSATAASSSTDIQGQIQDALKKDPTCSNSNITVSVTDDAVELNGTVASNDEKKAAKKIAKSYAGSRKVKDNLTVSGGGSKTTPPGGMGFVSAGAYRQSQSSQQSQQPTMPSGSQSPSSQSPSTSQSPSGEPSSTQTTPVPNGSTSQQTPSSSEQTPSSSQQTPGTAASAGGDIQMQIQNALQKEPTLSSDTINVAVSDDAIELNGTVASGKEKQTAKRIAQSYAGNRKVKDHLTVSGQGANDNKSPDSNTSTPPSSNSPTTPDPNRPAYPPASSRPPQN